MENDRYRSAGSIAIVRLMGFLLCKEVSQCFGCQTAAAVQCVGESLQWTTLVEQELGSRFCMIGNNLVDPKGKCFHYNVQLAEWGNNL